VSVRRPHRPVAPAALAAAGLGLLLPATAAGAPAIAPAAPGADDAWGAAEGPPSYVITGTAPGATLRWQLRTGDGVPLPRPEPPTGPSPLTVTLGGLADGGYELVAGQVLPADPGRTARAFTVDTVAPVVTIREPRQGAVYGRGERHLADYSCTGAATCQGTVADGAPIDTSAAGARALTVTAADAAGNTAVARVEYRVAEPLAVTGAAVPAGTPTPPAPPIRLGPPPPGDPQAAPEPETRNPGLLRPPAGSVVTTRRPVLRWRAVAGAELYNVQVYRLRGEQATKVVSDFPQAGRYRVPAGRLAVGERYVWRVWPLVDGAYPAEPHGLSWFDVRRPVRLTPAQLLVNQRIAQAAVRRTAGLSAWLDARLVTGDLRDGGLGPREFAADVGIAGAGAPIANGLAAPRPVVVPEPARTATARPRVRVSAAQLLVNQRISQAAVRRANALARRLDQGLTGGDLRPRAVTAAKLAPGTRIEWALPAGPAPPPARAPAARVTRRPAAAVTASARQVLVNQRISQAAVRRANRLVALVEGGLTGAQFRDGAISAVSVAAPPRP
jgi:hypothetical protein